MKTPPPFNLRILQEAQKMAHRPAGAIQKLTASDGTPLAVHQYKPKQRPKATLVFYHGGGAHAGAGYQLLAHDLAESFGVAVYAPDLRGHGESGGDRGDAPSREQVWNDIDTVLDYVIESSDTEASVFIGGHSSGGGLVLNYLTEHRLGGKQPSLLSDPTLKGCVLVSPQLGYKAAIDRPLEDNQVPFARVNVLAFIGNGISGWWGHNHAVQFSYPDDVLKDDPGMVRSNTVNMANAITPVEPKKQFDDINLPLKLWIGEADEIFLPERVASFAQDKPNMSSEILPDETHLGILVNIHKQLGPWIHSHL